MNGHVAYILGAAEALGLGEELIIRKRDENDWEVQIEGEFSSGMSPESAVANMAKALRTKVADLKRRLLSFSDE